MKILNHSTATPFFTSTPSYLNHSDKQIPHKVATEIASKNGKANGNPPRSDIQTSWETDAGCIGELDKPAAAEVITPKQDSKHRVEKTERERP